MIPALLVAALAIPTLTATALLLLAIAPAVLLVAAAGAIPTCLLFAGAWALELPRLLRRP